MSDDKGKPNAWSQRHDATTDAAQAIVDDEKLKRDTKTARLKEAREAKTIEVAPEKPKRKR